MQVLKLINPVAEMAIDPDRVASVVASAVSRAISEVTRPGVTDQLASNQQAVQRTPAPPPESSVNTERSSNR